MGFIKAFTGALGGTFADQWKDYYVPMTGVPATAGLFRAVPNATNAGRGENTKGSENVITNGTKIVVPEGTALITVQDGAITGLIAEPGGYEYRSNDPNSRSLFSGDGILASTIGQSWERFKFGGQPATQQLAFYVNLKEIPGLRFGTKNPIDYYDQFLQTQARAVANGVYSLKIVDPLLFAKGFVPVQYLQPNAPIFDFADIDNDAASMMFEELVGSLGAAFSNYTSDPEKGGMISKIRGDSLGFTKVLADVLEQTYNWKANRGVLICSTTLSSIDYDEETRELLKKTQEDDREIRRASRMGQAYGANMAGMMAAASGQAMQNAAANENGAMMGFMGMNMAQQGGANLMGAINNMPQQPPQPMPAPGAPVPPQPAPAAPTEDPYAKLTQLKNLLDQGVISQEDFDAAKNKLLGI